MNFCDIRRPYKKSTDVKLDDERVFCWKLFLRCAPIADLDLDGVWGVVDFRCRCENTITMVEHIPDSQQASDAPEMMPFDDVSPDLSVSRERVVNSHTIRNTPHRTNLKAPSTLDDFV